MALLGYVRNHHLSGRKNQLPTSWIPGRIWGKKNKRKSVASLRQSLLLFAGRFSRDVYLHVCCIITTCGRRTLLFCIVQYPGNALGFGFKLKEKPAGASQPVSRFNQPISRLRSHPVFHPSHSHFLWFARRHQSAAPSQLPARDHKVVSLV